MTPYKTNKANILYSAWQNNMSNNNFQIADTCTHCVPIFLFVSSKPHYQADFFFIFRKWPIGTFVPEDPK